MKRERRVAGERKRRKTYALEESYNAQQRSPLISKYNSGPRVIQYEQARAEQGMRELKVLTRSRDVDWKQRWKVAFRKTHSLFSKGH